MKRLATLLLILTLVLSGCASNALYSYDSPRTGASCPRGTMMVCEVGSLRGCRCGQYIVFN